MKNSSRRGQRTTNNSSRTQRSTSNNSRTQRSTSNSSQRTASNTNSDYTTVAPNIYRDGSSYRARVTVNGIRYSRNCRTKREAIQWRNEMISDRA